MQLDLDRLRVYITIERTKTGCVPILVLDDDRERIEIRPGVDPGWSRQGVDRLVAGALDLMANLEIRQAVPQ